MEGILQRKRIRLKCRYDNEIRVVIISPEYTYAQLYKRLTMDYGFDISLRYEDEDGDLITLTSQNDFEDLIKSDVDTVNVIVTENMLPSVHKPQSNQKVSSLWSQGGAPMPGWDQHTSQRSQSPFLHHNNNQSSLSTVRSSNRLLERFPHIESPHESLLSERSTRWKKGEILGQGAFGVVYLGLNVESGELMAVKQINNDELNTKELQSLQNEINVLRTLKHPNIVRYIGTERNPSTLSIFLEYVPGGSLKSLIDKFGKLEEPVVRSYTRQILLGLEYLHRNGIAHRDIKGANCLVGNDGAVKLADFGASNSWRCPVENKETAEAAAQDSGHHEVRGTPSWMSPEVIRGEKPLNWKKADVWSLGCTTIEMTTGSPPWSQFSNPVTVLYHIACSEAVPEYPEDPSIELLTFLNACLKRNPHERTDITSLLLHPFVANLQAHHGGISWANGGWGPRPTTVSTTPSTEWDDSVNIWKSFTNTGLMPSHHNDDNRDGSSLINECNDLHESISTSRKPSISELDLEDTVRNQQFLDIHGIMRTKSSREGKIKSEPSSQAAAARGGTKRIEDKSYANDLVSVDSIEGTSLENSLETFQDDLEESTSTLESGRVLLESLDGVGSTVYQDDVKSSDSRSQRLSEVKISPINEKDNKDREKRKKKKSVIDDKQNTSRQEPSKTLSRSYSGSSGQSVNSESKSTLSSTVGPSSALSSPSIPNEARKQIDRGLSSLPVKDSPQEFVSPLRHPQKSLKEADDKRYNSDRGDKNKTSRKSECSPSSSASKSAVQSHRATSARESNAKKHSGVPSSPIRRSQRHKSSKPFEFSNKPGERKAITSNKEEKSSIAVKPKSRDLMTSTAKSSLSTLKKVKKSSGTVSRGGGSARFPANETHDEDKVYEESEDKNDDMSASELPDDIVDISEGSDGESSFIERGVGSVDFNENSMATFDWLKGSATPYFRQRKDNQSPDANWTAETSTMKRKAAKNDSSQTAKTCLGQSLSSSALSSEITSDPDIGGYELVGHSYKQSGVVSGTVQGTRIKTSIPSSKQSGSRTRSSVGSSMQNRSRGGEPSAFRNLKVAGDSIDLRIGTGASSNMLGLDDGLDSIGVATSRVHADDEQSEESFALPLSSEGDALNEHTAAVTKLRIVPNKNIFVSASLDGSIRVWRTEGSTSSCAVMDIRSFDAKAKKAVPTTPKLQKYCGLWVDQDFHFVWGGCSDGIVRVWSGGEMKPHRMLKGHDDMVNVVEGTPQSFMTPALCASASLDKTARVWDIRAKNAQCSKLRGHGDTIYSIKWLDGGKHLATASKDKTIKIWDVRTGRVQQTLDKHFGSVNLLKNIPEEFKCPSRRGVVEETRPGSCFISASRDGTLCVWSSDGSCLASQGAHRAAVTSMSEVQSCNEFRDTFGASGPCVATSGADDHVRIWDIKRARALTDFGVPNVVKVAWFNHSVITGSSSGNMYIWDYFPPLANDESVHATDKCWSARELTHHTHSCSDIVASKYCVASASKSGNILRYSAL